MEGPDFVNFCNKKSELIDPSARPVFNEGNLESLPDLNQFDCIILSWVLFTQPLNEKTIYTEYFQQFKKRL